MSKTNETRMYAGELHDDISLLAPRGANARITFEAAGEELSVAKLEWTVTPAAKPKPDLGFDEGARVQGIGTGATALRRLLRKDGVAWSGGAIELARLSRGRSMLRFLNGERAAMSIEIAPDDAHTIVTERFMDQVDRAVSELDERGGALLREIKAGFQGASRDGATVTFDIGRPLQMPLHVLAVRREADGFLDWAWAIRQLKTEPATITTATRARVKGEREGLTALVRPSIWVEPGFGLTLARLAAWYGGAREVFAAQSPELVQYWALE